MIKLPRRSSIKFLLAASLLATALFVYPNAAHALRISLQRVVFEGDHKSEILTIINNSDQSQTYRLGWRKYRMNETQPLQLIEDGQNSDDILSAENMVRFAPKRITVPAGGSQQVRLLFRPEADMKEAEYRAHLWIVTETRPAAFDAAQANPQGQSVLLAVQPAVSLPVFVRHGDLTASTTISDLKAGKTGNELSTSFTINREGNRSLYGDLDFICKSGGTDLVLYQVHGISVYTEVKRRVLDYKFPLDTPEKQACTNMEVVYRADPDDMLFKGDTLAQASVQF
jgi:P pilus assembly chaperone PapD